ncbi:MAG: hypothetical protein ABII18_05800 [bacterium]
MKTFKISPWIYLIIFFVVVVLTMFLLDLLFPGLSSKESEELSTLLTLSCMALSFIFTYLLFNLIEKGKTDLSGGIRLIIGFISLSLGSSLFLMPFFILGVFSGGKSILNNLLEVIFLYVGGFLVVIVLATLLSWINKSSPQEELKKSIGIF